MARAWSFVIDGVIAVSALAVAGILALNYFDRRSSPNQPEAHAYEVGSVLPQLQDIDYTAAERTAVLVLRSTCPVCTDSMNFYRALATRASDDGRVRIAAVSREDVDSLRSYLSEHNVKVDAYATTTSDVLQTFATPIVFVVDRTGVIYNVWVGRLTASQEQEVVAALMGA